MMSAASRSRSPGRNAWERARERAMRRCPSCRCRVAALQEQPARRLDDRRPRPAGARLIASHLDTSSHECESITLETRVRLSEGVAMTEAPVQGIKTVLHPVSDLAKATPIYTALLGQPPAHEADYYVGFEVAGQHIGLVPGGGPQGMTSPVAYWHVSDIEARLAEMTSAGATVKEPARDVGGGRLVATVTDPDGNVLGLLQDR